MTAGVPHAATGRGEAVDQLFRLYPAPLQVAAQAADARGSDRRFVALPSVSRARMVVSIESPALASRALRRQLTGQRLRTRAARAGLTIAARTGLLPHLPGCQLRVSGPVDAGSVEDALCEVLGVSRLFITMPIGPPRANRKPVLQVTDRAGQVLAFVKVGHNELTRRLVRQEGEALQHLTGVPWKTVRAPRLLGMCDWRDLTLLVQEPLPTGGQRARGRAGRRRLLAVVDEIATSTGLTTHRWADHPLRARLQGGLSSCGSPGQLLEAELARIPEDMAVPSGSWHGDLNPGNVALGATTSAVWDWERFEAGVPVGFDLLHHDLHHAITVGGRPPLDAASELLTAAPQLLSRWQVGPVDATAVARAYLLTLGERYLRDQQHVAGASLGHVERWLIPALQNS